MRLNRVVARYRSGDLVKGMTTDFDRAALRFHVEPTCNAYTQTVVDVRMLKAVFFVRELAGDRYYDEDNEFDEMGRPVGTIRVTVRFRDGEILRGYTHERERRGEGFFMIPSDPFSNNRRIFVVYGAVENLYFQ
ncbi:MAG TPA: hypothetical protein QGF58_27350 [Myxococcota bacterium]|nr:hypothetical protein [Myxococcota bacterium]